MSHDHTIELEHIERKTARDENPNWYAVRVDGAEVFRASYVRGNLHDKIDARTRALALHAKVKGALATSDIAREADARHELASRLYPLIVDAQFAHGATVNARACARRAFEMARDFEEAAREDRDDTRRALARVNDEIAQEGQRVQ